MGLLLSLSLSLFSQKLSQESGADLSFRERGTNHNQPSVHTPPTLFDTARLSPRPRGAFWTVDETGAFKTEAVVLLTLSLTINLICLLEYLISDQIFKFWLYIWGFWRPRTDTFRLYISLWFFVNISLSINKKKYSFRLVWFFL